jgi:hypothetical protein
LFHFNGETSAQSNTQLYEAMLTENRLEQTEYEQFGSSAPYQQNGVFYRDDIQGTFSSSGWPSWIPNKYTSPTDNPPYGQGSSPSNPYYFFGQGPQGHPWNQYVIINSDYSTNYGGSCNKGSMSIDQAVKMLWGLAFVVRLVPSGGVVINGYDVHDEAVAAMGRIINWCSGIDRGPLEWYIYDPNRSRVCQGSYTGTEAWGLRLAARNYCPGAIDNNFIASAAIHELGWAFVVETSLALSGGRDPIITTNNPYGQSEWEAKLAILAGPRFAGWKKDISHQGDAIHWPFLDLASALLNNYTPRQNQSHWQSLLTNPAIPPPNSYPSLSGYTGLYYPYCWPCEMPLMDYEAAEGTPELFMKCPYNDCCVDRWNNGSYDQVCGIGKRPQDYNLYGQQNPNLGVQYNGLDYMLLYDLYCQRYQTWFLDVANGRRITYADLQNRIVTATYPLTALSGSGSTIGTATNHLFVGAETSMLFQGGVANAGTYVDFMAPHLGAPSTTAGAYVPNAYFWAKNGSVVTLTSGRPPCGSAVIPGTTEEYKDLDENSPDMGEDTLPSLETYLHYIDSLKADYLASSQYTDDSTLSDVDYTLNVYPNPVNTQAQIMLTLSTSARVSMEVDDVYGDRVDLVLSESELSAGNNDYIFDRGDLVSGTYLLTVYINGKRFVKKLVII